MSPHLPDDLFRLNLAFEPSQRIVQRLAFLQTHFSQISPPSRARLSQAQLQLTVRVLDRAITLPGHNTRPGDSANPDRAEDEADNDKFLHSRCGAARPNVFAALHAKCVG